MKKKIVSLLLATTMVLSMVACGNNDSDDKDEGAKDKVRNERDETQESDEVSESLPEDDPQNDIPEIIEGEGLDEARKTAYAEKLGISYYNLSYYYWQFDYEYNDWGSRIIGENPVIAITDVNNDGWDELLIVSAADYNSYEASLDIYSVDDNGELITTYSGSIDLAVAGGTSYYLFKGTDGILYGYSHVADEGIEGSYFRIVGKGDGSMEKEEIVSFAKMPNDDYSDTISTYYIDGAEIDEAEYEKITQDLLNKATEVVLYNAGCQNEVDAIGNFIGMRYGEAMSLLKVNRDADDDMLPIYDVTGLTFSSGVGGWATDMELHADGSFIGIYYDSDMGDIGDDYPDGTIYQSHFEGNLKQIKKINDYTYELTLDGWTQEETPGEVKIEGGMRFIGAGPYGIEGGTTFYFYLPGAKVSDLPEEYVDWIYGLSDREYLPNFGLYNVDQQEGFIAY